MLRKLLPWLTLYGILIITPLVLMLAGPLPPGRNFWVEFAVGLGFAGLAMMSVQFILTARFKNISQIVGMDSMLLFHREMGIVAFLFVLAHPIILLLHNFSYISFFDPRVNLPRAVFLTGAMIALILVVVLPLIRKSLRMSYQWWRLTHGVAAAMVVFVGLSHIIMVGHYVSAWWKQALWIVLIATSLYLLAHTRVIKPLMSKRRPWKVKQVQTESFDIWTLVLSAQGHDGLSFLPGQCVWLTLGPSPYSLEQHPFTIASSAESPNELKITIKALGDFTSSIDNVLPGTEAWIEGPYGKFTYDSSANNPVVLITGGIGITPAISMLRTMRDRGERRETHIFCGSVSRERVLFEDELMQLEREINLRVVHLLDTPADNFPAEKGPINQVLLTKLLRGVSSLASSDFFVCGPEPMMNVVESALLQLDVPPARIHTERFNIV